MFHLQMNLQKELSYEGNCTKHMERVAIAHTRYRRMLTLLVNETN